MVVVAIAVYPTCGLRYGAMKLKTHKISRKRSNVINGMNGVKYHYERQS